MSSPPAPIPTINARPEAPFDVIPGPPAGRSRGALPFLLSGDPTARIEELTATYGDLCRVRLGKRDAYLFNHPDLIRDVLVTHARYFGKGEGLQRSKRLLGEGLLTSEGDFHLRQRRLMQPLFLKGRIQGFGAAMGRHATRHADGWRDGQELDLTREMGQLTLSVVGETLFSTDLTNTGTAVREALDRSLAHFDQLNSPWAPLLEFLPFGPGKKARSAKASLDAILYTMIDQQRAAAESGAGQDDLLSLLLQSRYDDDTKMSREQVRDEAMTLFLAGHETTANALAWTFLLLSSHPDVERELHEESVEVLGRREAGADDVANLPLARAIISESMRLYPPAWIIGRKALADYAFTHEGHSYCVPQGSVVAMSQWVMHRDPRFWPQPTKFLPARWLTPEEPGKERPKFAWFPFGAGVRQCIGENFAWMEAILLLASLSQRWRLERAEQAPVQKEPRITLRPRGPVLMRVRSW